MLPFYLYSCLFEPESPLINQFAFFCVPQFFQLSSKIQVYIQFVNFYFVSLFSQLEQRSSQADTVF